MFDERQYAELKKVLRAILISIKGGGVTVQDLELIYRESEGKRMPLFGHSDTLGLLNSMTDTVYTVSRTTNKRKVFIFSLIVKLTEKKKLDFFFCSELLQKKDGARMLVFPITNENTCHISNLVAGQNVNGPR